MTATDLHPDPPRRSRILKILLMVAGVLLLANLSVAGCVMLRPYRLEPNCLASSSPDGALLVRACRARDEHFKPLEPARYDYQFSTPGAGREFVVVGHSAERPTHFAAWRGENTVILCGLGVIVRGARIVEVPDASGDLRRVRLVTECG